MPNKTWTLQVCEEQNKTLHIHSNSDGNLGPPTCTECCDTDLCNAKGCSQPGMIKGTLTRQVRSTLTFSNWYFYYICFLLLFIFFLLIYFLQIIIRIRIILIDVYTVERFLSWFWAPSSRLSSITRKRASLFGMFTTLRQSRMSGNSPLQELRGNRNHFIFHNSRLNTKLFISKYIHMYM